MKAAVPSACDVAVVGGGPAGSSVATLLARDGVDVVLLEKARHPRPNVGESLLPQIWKYTDALGASGALEREGFLGKPGGVVLWGDRLRRLRFADFGYSGRSGLHVERDRFDEILLRHAAASGARVLEEVAVREVDFADPVRPLVAYEDRRGGAGRAGALACRYVVDASGSSTLLAGQLGARRLVASAGRFLGMWGYFEGTPFLDAEGVLQPAGRLGAVKPATFLCSYADGWAWHIALRRRTSVGLVVNAADLRGPRKEAREAYFLETCAGIPALRGLLEGARHVPGSVCFRPDYSYYSERVCGPGFFCVGDAASFVDPIFSQGVLTALFNAAVCAWAVRGALENPSRRDFFAEVFRRRLLEHYGFYRLLAFGDFGGEGIELPLVSTLMRSRPRSELALALSFSGIVDRAQNFRQAARAAGLHELAELETAGPSWEATARLGW